MNFDAFSIIANKTISAGNTIKIIDSSANSREYPDISDVRAVTQGVRVDLSPESLKVSEISQGANTIASKDFDSFLDDVHVQLAERSKDADIIKVKPQDNRPERLVMSKQAANYLLSAYYSSEAAFSEVSSNNPFEELDRLSLSNIAFDNTERFTPVERQLAFYEVSRRDIEYRNRTFDLQDALRRKDNSAPWGEITSYLRDAQLTTAMSDGERAWRGWGSADSLKNHALMLAGNYDVSKLQLPSYEDSSLPEAESFVSELKDGSFSVKDGLTVSHSTSSSDVLDFIFAATEGEGLEEVSLVKKGKESNSWVFLYSKIYGYTQE